MTRISDLGTTTKEIAKNIFPVLEEYDVLIAEVSDRLRITGKTLEMANRETPSYYAFYAEKCAELKILLDYLEIQLKATQSRLYRQYKNSSDIVLSEREMLRYVDNEPKYLEFYSLLLEVKEVYEKFKHILDSFTMRGYALNNITKARIAEIHEIEL